MRDVDCTIKLDRTHQLDQTQKWLPCFSKLYFVPAYVKREGHFRK